MHIAHGKYIEDQVNKFIGIVNSYADIVDWNVKITYAKSVFSSNRCNEFATNARGGGERLFYLGEFRTKDNHSFALSGDLSNETHIKNAIERGIETRGQALKFEHFEIGQYPDVELTSPRVKEIIFESNVVEIDRYIENINNAISIYELSVDLDMSADYIEEYFINAGKIVCTSDETKVSLTITVYSDVKIASKTLSSRKLIDFSEQVHSFLRPYSNIAASKVFDGSVDAARVVFSAEALGHLMKLIFINNIDGYEVGNNRTFLNKEMIGHKVLGDFTVVDDGCLSLGVGSCRFDMEGTASQRTVLFDNGFFITPLINNSSRSYFEQEGLSLTGNAVDEKYVDVTNLFMTNDKHMVDNSELYSGDYILIKGLRGYNGNPLNGDFRLESKAAEVYINGKLAGVKDLVVSGNLFEIFQDEKILVSTTKMVERYNLPEISTQVVKLH